jgi:DtxR family transcriptional regulator, Mn-dependent transcriptional regulator
VELSQVERETVKAVFRLAPESGPVRTGDLASALSVAPGSATARVQRLAERGLVTYEPYRGVELTEVGRRAAAAAMRRHRIVERFLSDMLGYRWEDADRLAVTFEHDLPAEVVSRLYVALDRPATCPHGFPIPDADSDEVPALPSLATQEPGTHASVALPGATAPDVVAFLDKLGVRPGAHVLVRERHPFDGPVVVRVGGKDRTLGNKLARQIFVHPR